MDPGVRRRLDALVLLCSGLLGVVVTYLLASERAGLTFLLFALVPTAVVAFVAFWYVDGAAKDAGGRDS